MLSKKRLRTSIHDILHIIVNIDFHNKLSLIIKPVIETVRVYIESTVYHV